MIDNSRVLDIDTIIELKTVIYNEMTVLYDSLINVKSDAAIAEYKFTTERAKIIKELDTKAIKKEAVEANVIVSIDKDIYENYIRTKNEVSIIETKIEKLRATAKELSDILVAYGIKAKILNNIT